MEDNLQIYCENNHVLAFSSRDGEWVCNICNKDYIDINSYYCTECDYDCCVDCGKALDIKRKIIDAKLTCQFNHPLQFAQNTDNLRCISCKQALITSIALTCQCMNFCCDCANALLEAQNSGSQINQDLTCFQDHILVKSYKVCQSNIFICNICRQKVNANDGGVRHCYVCDFDLCNNCESTMVQCEAKGFYDYNGQKESMNGTFMIFSNGIIHGRSNDTIGNAKWTGTYTDGACSLDKQYIGKHKVAYDGKLIGSKIVGQWDINGTKSNFELEFSSDFFSKFPNMNSNEAIDISNENYYQNYLTGKPVAYIETEKSNSRGPSDCRLCQQI